MEPHQPPCLRLHGNSALHKDISSCDTLLLYDLQSFSLRLKPYTLASCLLQSRVPAHFGQAFQQSNQLMTLEIRYLRAFGNGVLGNLEYQYFSVGGEISLGRKVATFFGKGTLSVATATVVWVTPMVLAAVEKLMLYSMVGSDLKVSCKATNTRSNFRLVSRISKGLETMIRGPVPNPNSVRVQNPPQCQLCHKHFV
ncbi:hypothetical protein NC653_040599 [Populus alba x Populus x berolinensis]|uniref:Uncharacterized protein n=1 Tax=Populus alba x Populus x berolinensis TaxID=444605 RepID=A0AAD6L7K5_9ROSI|nr:hypothetical protein NC653_040599 [Populus alba x Populus x berolinensis]